jgi:hypothetical protein
MPPVRLLTKLPGRRFEPQSLERTLSDQEDLDVLCARREFTTAELFPPNAYYGNDQVVKAFAGLPADYALKIAIPHAVEAHYPPNFSRREDVPVAVYFAHGRDVLYRAMGIREVWGMASPYVLAAELCGAGTLPTRAGTLFFPTHSGADVRVRYDVERVADELLALPDEHQPVTVCVFWLDYLYGLHRPYEERGLRLVSAGHQADPQFLVRFYQLCKQHRFAMSNDVGTHCFYAIKAGCHYSQLDGPAEWDGLFIQPDDDPVHLGVRALFRQLSERPHTDQLTVVDRYLGTRHMRSRDDLAGMLGEAELLDKVGVARLRVAGGGRLAVSGPWWLRRRLRRFLKHSLRRLRGLVAPSPRTRA